MRPSGANHFLGEYTVTFHSNGGSPAPGLQSVMENDTVDEPAAMTKALPPAAGLYLDPDTPPVFGGWYKEPALNTLWDFSTDMVTEDVTLYAKWTDTSVDLSGYSGNTLENALAYIAGQSLVVITNYTILLDAGTYNMSGVSAANISTANAVITLLGNGPSETVIRLSGNGYMFNIANGELILDNNITLQGHSSNTTSLVNVSGSASLTMNSGAKIKGNTSALSGGGVYVSSGTFIMNSGATISGNSATNVGGGGGGVYVDSGGGFTMNGGVISGNTAYYNGGGVYIRSGGSFSKSGDSVIYGDDDTTHTAGADENTAKSGNAQGHAVWYAPYYCDDDLNEGDDISTSDPMPGSGQTVGNWTRQ
jgi:uncharacterized repeat protein (TIGR02543 family)